jgi:hypothetical protein
MGIHICNAAGFTLMILLLVCLRQCAALVIGKSARSKRYSNLETVTFDVGDRIVLTETESGLQADITSLSEVILLHICRSRWCVMVIVLEIGLKVCGIKPGRRRCIFKGNKNP